ALLLPPYPAHNPVWIFECYFNLYENPAVYPMLNQAPCLTVKPISDAIEGMANPIQVVSNPIKKMMISTSKYEGGKRWLVCIVLVNIHFLDCRKSVDERYSTRRVSTEVSLSVAYLKTAASPNFIINIQCRIS